MPPHKVDAEEAYLLSRVGRPAARHGATFATRLKHAGPKKGEHLRLSGNLIQKTTATRGPTT